MPDLTTFFVYCFDKDGRYYPGVALNSIEEVKTYIHLHKDQFHKIRITDTDDSIVLQVVNGIVVWPKADCVGN